MGREGLLGGHLESAHHAQNSGHKEHQLASDAIGLCAPHQQTSHCGLYQHAGSVDMHLVELVHNVARWQGQDQGGYELKQANQA